MMHHDRTEEPPADGPRPFSSADSVEQRLRAEAALSREELEETMTELVRRTTGVGRALRKTGRRRGTRLRGGLQRAREEVMAHQIALVLGLGATACCAAAIAFIPVWWRRRQ